MNSINRNDQSNSRTIFIFALIVFVGIGAVLSVVVFGVFYQWGERAESPVAVRTPVINAQGTLVVPEDEPSGSFQLVPEMDVDQAEPWDGTKRVTVLVMGVDYRDWKAGTSASRTDTMMLLTIDPVAKTAGALSIPRDLWAAIPGFNPAKINTAHYYGEIYNYPGGGPALAVKTVENVIGVPIDYYVRLDFNAFVEFIDFIGGVKVDVTETIELEIIGQTFDTVLTPGRYTLDGRQALAYARNRYNKGGDFDRARRQQQIILGIRERLVKPEVWTKLLANAPQLYNRFSQKILTNMPFEDALKLGALAVQVDQDDIEMDVIGLEEVNFGTSFDELSILIPYPDDIREIRDRIFATGGSFSPALEGDPKTLMQIENASIVIYDGATDGGVTAERTMNYLRDQGAKSVSVQPAGQTYSSTSLIYHTGSPYTLAYLADLMGVGTYGIFQRLALNSSTDIEVWLGTDWQYNNNLP